jgi:hypothetical protein
MKQALEIAKEWAIERRQWGAAVGHHEAVANKLATMAADIYAVESLTWLTSAMADKADLDIRLEAALAKLFCSEVLWKTADEALQIRGGRGYETAQSLAARGELPMPMERLLRDARINLIIEGTSEIMRLFIAREALDPHLKAAGASATSEKVDIIGAAKFYASWYPKLFLPNLKLDDQFPIPSRLRKHSHALEKGVRRLARDLFHMISLHRQGLQKRQMILGRLVDCGAELFAMAAVLSFSSSPMAPEGADELADLFCRQARRRLKSLRSCVYRQDDRAAYKVARDLLDGKYSWLSENIVTSWRRK